MSSTTTFSFRRNAFNSGYQLRMSKSTKLADMLESSGLAEASSTESAEILDRACALGLNEELLNDAIREIDLALTALRNSNTEQAIANLTAFISMIEPLRELGHELWGTISPFIRVQGILNFMSEGKYTAQVFEQTSEMLATVRSQLSDTLSLLQ